MAKVQTTIGDYLKEHAPPFSLWTDLLGLLFEHNATEPRFERVGPAGRTVYLVRMFGGQVVNGGFHQFLANSSGDYATETLQALRQVGAIVSWELLERALSLFPGRSAPRDQRERLRLLFPITGPMKEILDELDRRFYREVDPIEGEGRESLDGLLLTYMQARAGEAVIAGPISSSRTARE